MCCGCGRYREREREGEAATSKQAGRKGRCRGSGARVLRGVSAITQGRGPLAIIPFAQPTNGTPLCLFPLPSLSSFASSPLSPRGRLQPMGRPSAWALQAAAGATSPPVRPAGRPAPQLASAQIKQLLIHGRRPRHTRDARAVMPPQNLSISSSAHHVLYYSYYISSFSFFFT